MKPPDRTRQVWEIPVVGTVFVVTGPPWLHEVLGWQHPALLLVRPANDDPPAMSTVQEPCPVMLTSFEDRGWKRLA
jgi:hypothetical protein